MAHDSRAPLRVALLGGGVVGSSVARTLLTQGAGLAARVGAPLELIGIAVRDVDKERPGIPAPKDIYTQDAASLVTKADIVIEVMGGIEPARSLILSAMEHGASVVTANKALLGEDGPTLYGAAAEHKVDLYYEGAVVAAVPLLRPFRESLVGDDITRVLGIVNGTTNYVLDKMDSSGADLDETVKAAQELGYAEADPTADVEGYDAAAKAAILASLAFHTRVSSAQVYREGITGVTSADIKAAQDMGCVIKLLAICERMTDAAGAEAVSVRVHPALIARDHPLASVRDAFNAVFVQARLAGEMMFYGRGAGSDATASSVLGDVVSVARHKVAGSLGPGESAYADLPVLAMEAATTSYHVSLDVADQPGVLAEIASVFAAHQVSIDTVRQYPSVDDDSRATLTIMTHRASDGALAATVANLGELASVHAVVSVLRVEGV